MVFNLDNNFILSRLQGRTGNIMFQVANGFARSLDYNRQFLIPSGDSGIAHLENNILRNFDIINLRSDDTDYNMVESPYHYMEFSEPLNHKPTIYKGWYQSEKFFKKYTNIIKSYFGPDQKFINEAYVNYPFIKDTIVGVINVRRGDYLTQSDRHPVITKEYIFEGLKNIPKCDNYLILSDDLDWCKENIKIDNSHFVSNYWDNKGIWLMSLCHHFIISNSSFSWWSAYLSKYENKKIVTPSIWVGPGIIENMNDVWCEDWIKIDCKYNKGKIELNYV